MFPRTFRALSTAIAFWVAVAFAAVMLGDTLIRGAWSTFFSYLAPLLLVLWVMWITLWRTSVRALPDRALVTNVLRVHDVPWSRVTDVRQGAQLVLELDGGRKLACWGAPFPTRPGIPRRPTSTNSRDSAQAPMSFAETLEAYRRSAPKSGEPARARWDVVALGIGAVLVVATIVTPLLVS